jgi:hypothetical protein
MSVTESLYVPVRYRAAELGCTMPAGIAILPDNFCEAKSRLELLVRGESVTLRNVFESASAPLESFFPLGEHVTFGHDNGLAWEASLFVSADLIADDPGAVAKAMTLISAYLADFFKGHPERRIRLVVVVEQKHQADCRRLTYEGDAFGVSALTANVLDVAAR